MNDLVVLLLDQEGSLAAISKLLPDNVNERRAALAAMRDVLSATLLRLAPILAA
jgi:hypothetical protein